MTRVGRELWIVVAVLGWCSKVKENDEFGAANKL